MVVDQEGRERRIAVAGAIAGHAVRGTTTAPLSSFARAAENFSLDGADAALPERGPEEIRSVARAFNRMRQRISGLIDDRTRMLAAISHDLRTPITRMRLRSEFIEDEEHRNRMLADLEQTDDGPGISDADKREMLEPFARGDHARKHG